jgi:hypothetical protein
MKKRRGISINEKPTQSLLPRVLVSIQTCSDYMKKMESISMNGMPCLVSIPFIEALPKQSRGKECLLH